MPLCRLALIGLVAVSTFSACQRADLARTYPSISVTPSTLNFGEVAVGQSAVNTLTLFNSGTTALHVTSVQLVGTNTGAFHLLNAPGASTLEAGTSATLRVEYRPLAQGADGASVEIESDATNSPTVLVSLAGQSSQPCLGCGPDAGAVNDAGAPLRDAGAPSADSGTFDAGAIDAGVTLDTGFHPFCTGVTTPTTCTPGPTLDAGPVTWACTQPFPCPDIAQCPVPTPGLQYYVNAVSGNDANDGRSAATAWASLCHASEAVPNNSTVNVAEGTYPEGAVGLAKSVTFKAGYNSTFTAWNPQLYRARFAGHLSMNNLEAVWAGFTMMTSAPMTQSAPYHSISAGSFIRNTVEVTFNPTQSNNYGVPITVNQCVGSVVRLACNDLRGSLADSMTTSNGFVLQGIISSRARLTIDSNRICDNSQSWIHNAVALYPDCATGSSTTVLTNNVIEVSKLSSFGTASNIDAVTGGAGACDSPDGGIVIITNNTILATGGGVRTTGFRNTLINNVIIGQNLGVAVDLRNQSSNGILERSAGNLIFGFANSAIMPPPVSTAGDDVGGAYTVRTVFVSPDAGNYAPLLSGPAVGLGVNVYGQPASGAVTYDARFADRPDAGPWDRGAIAH